MISTCESRIRGILLHLMFLLGETQILGGFWSEEIDDGGGIASGVTPAVIRSEVVCMHAVEGASKYRGVSDFFACSASTETKRNPRASSIIKWGINLLQ